MKLILVALGIFAGLIAYFPTEAHAAVCARGVTEPAVSVCAARSESDAEFMAHAQWGFTAADTWCLGGGRGPMWILWSSGIHRPALVRCDPVSSNGYSAVCAAIRVRLS